MTSLFPEVKDAAMVKLTYELVGKALVLRGLFDGLWEDKRGKRPEGVIYGSQFVSCISNMYFVS